MKYKIDDKHQSDTLKISLKQDDMFKSRAKSVSMFGGSIVMDTETTRAFWKALDSRENFPITEIGVERGNGVVTIVPPYPGEIEMIELNTAVKLQTLSFLACSKEIDVNLNIGEIYDHNNLGTLTIEPNQNSDNILFISGYGGLDNINLDEGQQTNVREDYLVGFENTVKYDKSKSGGLKSKALGAKDKPMIKLTGPGTVYTHIRSPIKNEEVFDKLNE